MIQKINKFKSVYIHSLKVIMKKQDKNVYKKVNLNNKFQIYLTIYYQNLAQVNKILVIIKHKINKETKVNCLIKKQ